MKSTRSRSWLLLAAFGFLASATAGAVEDYAFMPKGGRTLLVEVLAPSTDELRKIGQTRRTEQQWREFVNASKNTLTEREQATLAAYLAVNMPLPEAALKQSNITAALPRDGRVLAWEQCQFCHSLFTSHLTQDRDAQAWRNMFQSPFHRELKMSPKEREEFARYSALNMPMKIEDIPQDLRF